MNIFLIADSPWSVNCLKSIKQHTDILFQHDTRQAHHRVLLCSALLWERQSHMDRKNQVNVSACDNHSACFHRNLKHVIYRVCGRWFSGWGANGESFNFKLAWSKCVPLDPSLTNIPFQKIWKWVFRPCRYLGSRTWPIGNAKNWILNKNGMWSTAPMDAV